MTLLPSADGGLPRQRVAPGTAASQHHEIEDGAGGDLATPLLPSKDYQEAHLHVASTHCPGSLSSYTRRYIFMGLWLLLLSAGYAVQRCACHWGLPDDCLGQVDALERISDLTDLALFGTVLGWFVGLTNPRRFSWLFSRRRWYVWAVYLGTPPVYSAISNVPALKHDLATLSSWGPAFVALEAAAGAAALCALGWHLRAAKRGHGWAGLAAYSLSRLLVLAWFCGSVVVLRREGSVVMHLHHYAIGWSLALWAEFNAPVSGVLLAVGAGIFTQGVAAYSFAPVFLGRDCFETPAAPEVECRFWAPAPFTVQVCPGSGSGTLPKHSCL